MELLSNAWSSEEFVNIFRRPRDPTAYAQPHAEKSKYIMLSLCFGTKCVPHLDCLLQMSPALSVNNLLSYLYAEPERSRKWNEYFLNDKIITQYTGVMKLSGNGKQCVALKGI